MNPTSEQVCRIGIIPVIAIDDVKKTVPLARSLVEGGLPVAEVTFRTRVVKEAMRATTVGAFKMLLDAGTALNREQVNRALAAGAKSIVSPGFDPDTVRHVKSKGGLTLSDTAAPGEMEQAVAFELEVVKPFPVEQNDGVVKLRAIAGPYKALKWMPTSGVSVKNLMDYLSFDQVVARGGTWMVKKDLIEAENWVEITRLTRGATDTMLGSSLAHVGINCLDVQASERAARIICDLFDPPFRVGNSSNHAGTAVECIKAPGPGVHGYIATGTSSVERVTHHLERCGVAIDHAICKTDTKGWTKAVYLEGNFGGLAVYLVQK